MNELVVGTIKGFVKGAVSQVPIAGPIVTAVYDEVVSASLLKRRAEWEKTIEQRLEALEDERIVEKLIGNESFVSCLIQATREALSTHQHEKIERFANAVVNSISSSLEDDKKQIFLRWIERYSELHILILLFSNDPAFWLTKAGISLIEPPKHQTLKQMLEVVYPNRLIDEDLIKLVINDLYSDGLIRTRGLSSSEIFDRGFTTSIAKEFINFVSINSEEKTR